MKNTYMKYKRDIIKILVELFLSVVVLLLLWGFYWRPLANMKELGYQELKPVAKAYKSTDESTQYMVVVEVNMFRVRGSNRAYIEIEQAYGEEDLNRCFKYYHAKKTVKGYYFYSEELEKIYFSKEIATAKEFMKSKADGVLEFIIGLDVAFLIAFLMNVFFKNVKAPAIPETWTGEHAIVCRYVHGDLGELVALCISLGAGLAQSAVYWLLTAETLEDGFAAIFNLLPSLMSIGFGVLIVLIVKNVSVVFCPEGIVHRDLSGKILTIPDAQVEGVLKMDALGQTSFSIRTKEKNIRVENFATNYYAAEEYVVEKYSGR